MPLQGYLGTAEAVEAVSVENVTEVEIGLMANQAIPYHDQNTKN